MVTKLLRTWFQGFTLHMNVYRFPGLTFIIYSAIIYLSIINQPD